LKIHLRPRDDNRYFINNNHLKYEPHPLPGDVPNYSRDRVIDIEHIKLDIKFNIDNKEVIGIAYITAVPINDGLKTLSLDATELNINSIKLDTGINLDYDVSDNKINIYFPSSLKSGVSFTITIRYDAKPRKGIYFTGPDEYYPNKTNQIWTQGEDEDNHYWFPCYDYPNDRFTSEMKITVPDSWMAISNGRLESISDSEDRKTKTFHWIQDRPHVTYLMTLCAGQFTKVSQGKVNGIPVEFYVQPGREDDGERAFGNTPSMIKLFTDLIGVPYPWAKYAQIAAQDFIFGGMENTSATTQTDLTLHDAKAHLDFSSDPLVAHELAHQWFGDLLTCRDWSHAWLNEGFATFFEAIWREHHLGFDEYKYDIYNMAIEYLKEDAQHYRRSIVTNVYRNPMDIFDRHLYEKGGLVLHMLRGILQEDLFWKAIRHYTNERQDSNVITSDLQNAIEESTGKNLDWFFEQWVFKGGHPDFKVSYSWEESKGTAKITVKQTQEVDMLTSIYTMPVDISFLTSKGPLNFNVHLVDSHHTFHFDLPERPKAVQFDPGYKVLKTIDFDRPFEMLQYQVEKDKDIIGRIEASKKLGELGTNKSIYILKNVILNDTFWGVQVEAAQALGTIKSHEAMLALIECVEVAEPKARRGVVRALGEFKNEDVADTLIKVINNDESYYVCAVALSSLGKSRSVKAYDSLIKALERDSHGDVIRAMAFQGLADLKDPRALNVAKEWVKYGKPPRVREAATAVLAKLGEDEKETHDILMEFLEDPWLRMRVRAISALEELKNQKAIPALERIVKRDIDGRVVRLAREAIIKIKQGKSAPDDVKKLRDSLEKLEEENRTLKDRVDHLEQYMRKANT